MKEYPAQLDGVPCPGCGGNAKDCSFHFEVDYKFWRECGCGAKFEVFTTRKDRLMRQGTNG